MNKTERLLAELHALNVAGMTPSQSLLARIQEHLDALEQGRKAPASDGTVTISMKVHPDTRINL